MLKSSRLDAIFNKGKAHVAYLTAGHGGITRSLDMALGLIEGGVNVLEIGLPFSDPVADGPVIQAAMASAIAEKTTIKDVIALIRQIRQAAPDVALIIFSYLNPLLSPEASDFMTDAASAGADGVLLVDAPLEESADVYQKCAEAGLVPIYVIAPSTPIERVKKINTFGAGFLYYACRNGVTGVRAEIAPDSLKKLQQIKAASTLPVVVGFGVSTREMVTQILTHADGAVIGSYFVNAIEKGITREALANLAREVYP